MSGDINVLNDLFQFHEMCLNETNVPVECGLTESNCMFASKVSSSHALDLVCSLC